MRQLFRLRRVQGRIHPPRGILRIEHDRVPVMHVRHAAAGNPGDPHEAGLEPVQPLHIHRTSGLARRACSARRVLFGGALVPVRSCAQGA